MHELRLGLLKAALPLVSFFALAASGACTATRADDSPVGSAVEPVSETRIADVSRDKPDHCAPKCGAGHECVAGKCEPTCSGTVCGGACVDLTSDPHNCGACGAACPAGDTCQEGACRASCSGIVCNGTCVDTTSDPDNCGACGAVCAPGDTCQEGACRASCSGIVCNGTCVDTTSDPDNCGACGAVCAPGKTCQAGVCD